MMGSTAASGSITQWLVVMGDIPCGPASQSRLLPVLALAWLALLEPVSWLTSRIPPCVIDAASYGTHYSENKECPPFHVFLVKISAAILEKLGEPAWATVAATIFIAAFTGTLWWSTHRLWKAGEIHSERQLRAYILVSEGRVFADHGMNRFFNISVGSHPSSKFQFKNFGQTPAYDLQILTEIVLEKWPLNPTKLLPIDFNKGRSSEILGPGGVRDQSYTAPDGRPVLTNEDITGLMNGSLAIFVYGEMHYKDAFGKDRITKYRYFTGGPMNLAGGMTLTAHYDGNEAT